MGSGVEGRGDIWGGCWGIGVGSVFLCLIKMGSGVEDMGNSCEMMILSMLYRPDGFKPEMNRRNVEVTHDEHAKRTGQESNAGNQNAFGVGFEPLRHRGTEPAEGEPAR